MRTFKINQRDCSYMALVGLKSTGFVIPIMRVTPEYVEQVVCDFYGLTPKEIRVRKRFAHLAKCRQIILFLTKRYTSMTLKRIGGMYNMDHSTVIHSIKIVSNLMETDKEYRKEVNCLELMIQ